MHDYMQEPVCALLDVSKISFMWLFLFANRDTGVLYSNRKKYYWSFLTVNVKFHGSNHNNNNRSNNFIKITKYNTSQCSDTPSGWAQKKELKLWKNKSKQLIYNPLKHSGTQCFWSFGRLRRWLQNWFTKIKLE